MLTLNVRATPGDDIETTAQELVNLADRLGVSVEMTLNGVWLIARPQRTRVRDLVDAYHDGRGSGAVRKKS